MKRSFALIFALMLFAIPFLSANAESTQPQNTEMFTSAQLESTFGKSASIIRQAVCLDDTIYAYLSNSAVCSWKHGDTPLNAFCQLPELLGGTSVPYIALSDEEKESWKDTVTFLAVGDGKLWGVNIFDGKVGEITSDGIQWRTQHIDASGLMPDGSLWPLRIVDAFVCSNMLYTYVALDNDDYPHNNYELLCFDLDSGTCSALDIQNAQGLCQYQQGKVLLLSYENDSWAFKTLDLVTRVLSESPFQHFAAPYDHPLGGMAYNGKTDSLFFSYNSQVWSAVSGGDYKAVAMMPIPELAGEATAFILSDGSYALLNDHLYIRKPQVLEQAPQKLLLYGCTDDGIYKSFIAEHPNVSVIFDNSILSPDEIAQKLVTQDHSIDIFATSVDYAFRSMVRKGYAADLSSSALLTEDIQTMHPNIAKAITDADGKPVAYPHRVYLGNWQVNIILWREIFGDTLLPTTYEQVMDAMVLWESDYADAYPEVDFAGVFDYADWARTLINAYAQQYGDASSPLRFDSPVLRTVLEKLAKASELRLQHGRGIHNDDGSFFRATTDLFVTAGYNNILTVPVDQAILDQTYDEMPEGAYIDLPPITFSEGEAPRLMGKMYVWFVNPFSANKALAIQYLEHAAQMQNNPVTYYGTHPDINEPLERSGYETDAETLEAKHSALLAKLDAAATPEAKAMLEEQLVAMDGEIAALEKSRWRISSTAIATYRELEPSICFFEDNPFVMHVGSSSEALQQVESVYQRYADGISTLDSFLRELEQRMNIMFKENN